MQGAARGRSFWLSYMKQDSGMLEAWFMPVPTAAQLQRPDPQLEGEPWEGARGVA